MDTAIYLNGVLRAIIRGELLPEIERIYPELYPGQRITIDNAPEFDGRGRIIAESDRCEYYR